jgi:uncharacterized protein (DUF58 family)
MSSPSTLLDAAFARELEALRRRMQVRARSGVGGEHLARRRGGSAEFLEHRPYTPGDDLRRIDWLAFARTGEPVLKLFRAEEDVVVRIVMDASASLDPGNAGGPSKLLAAKRLAASIAYLALAGSERAEVAVARDRLERTCAPQRGRAALPAILRELDAAEPSGGTDLAAAIDDTVLRAARPGRLVVVSDFLDPGAFDAAITRAASAGHDVALLHVIAPEELEPPYEGDLALEDVETGEVLEVTIDAAAVQAYAEKLDALIRSLRAIAKRHRAVYVRVVTTDPLLGAVRRFVARSVD